MLITAPACKPRVLPEQPEPPKPALAPLATANNQRINPTDFPGTGCFYAFVDRVRLSDAVRVNARRGKEMAIPTPHRFLLEEVTFDVGSAMLAALQKSGLQLIPYPSDSEDKQPSRYGLGTGQPRDDDYEEPELPYKEARQKCDYLLQAEVSFGGYNRGELIQFDDLCEEFAEDLRRDLPEYTFYRKYCLDEGKVYRIVYSGLYTELAVKKIVWNERAHDFVSVPGQIFITIGLAQEDNYVDAVLRDMRLRNSEVSDIFSRSTINGLCEILPERECVTQISDPIEGW